MSPGRKRNSHSLLYGTNQQRSRVRLQIEQRLEEVAFQDKVIVNQNAVQLLRQAARKKGPTSNGSSVQFDRSIGSLGTNGR